MLLTVFLFNVGGYYIVFWGLRFQSDQALNRRLDANLYSRSETIEIKIPISLPYPIYTDDFQRVDGRFEHKGEFFKLVKHKLQNDTLYIICIRDPESRQLVNTFTDYIQLAQSLPGTHQKALDFLSKLAKDFVSRAHAGIVHGGGFSTMVPFPAVAALFETRPMPVCTPPPEA